MSNGRIRSAVLGLADAGLQFIEAMEVSDAYDLIAVADDRQGCAERIAEQSKCVAYSDYRSLVVEQAREGLDLLFVALEPFESIEYSKLAAEMGVSVFHKTPVCRTLSEARNLDKHFRAHRKELFVSRPWVYADAVKPYLNRELGKRVFSAIIEVATTAEGRNGWRGDSVRSGGGVLLNGAYESFDLLGQIFGVAEEVTAIKSYAPLQRAGRPYDTEDAAGVALRFSGGKIGLISAARHSGDCYARLSLSFSVDDKGVADSPETLPGIERCVIEMRPGDGAAMRATELGALADYLVIQGGKPPATVATHLSTIAVIDAAYLSARTGAPERPSRFME